MKNDKEKVEYELIEIKQKKKNQLFLVILRKLKQLVDDGILSQEEFEAKKKEKGGIFCIQ